MTNPFTALPPKVRAWIYGGAFVVGVAFGGIQLGYDTAHHASPLWLIIGLKELPFLTAAFGLTALSNTIVKAIPRRAVVVDHVQPEAVKAIATEVSKRMRDERGRFRSPADRA